MIVIFLFVIAAAVFVAYAAYTHYHATPADQSAFKRVMLSVGLAVASIVSAIATFFSSGVSP